MNTATQPVQATVPPTDPPAVQAPVPPAVPPAVQAPVPPAVPPTVPPAGQATVPPTGQAPGLNTREQLIELLHQRRLALSRADGFQPTEGHRQAQISQDIWRRFGQTQAVLILDMANFSHLAHCQGILDALSRIQDMNAIVEPEILAQQGRLIKFEADNAFAVFPEVAAAVQAALNIFAAAAVVGIGVSIGIGYGDILLIEEPGGQDDFYGDEVNLASKLGEDTARSGELMITDAAYAQLEANALADPLAWQRSHVVLSNLDIPAHTWIGRPIHLEAKLGHAPTVETSEANHRV
jgi:adenylate cyclase